MEALEALPIQSGSDEAKEAVYDILSKIQGVWKFSNAKMSKLLHVHPNTYGTWMKNKKVPIGTKPYSPEMEVVISVIAIFRSLGAMSSSAKNQVLWLETPHPQIRGKVPLEFAMESIQNIFWLRHFLDYIRGRGA